VHEVLFTPWRYAYITGEKKAAEGPETEGCFFCAAARASDDPERLVVYRSAHHLVVLNRHPYTSGHLMVAPLVHAESPADVSEEAQAEFWPLVLEVRDVLAEAYSPDGMNLGMNLGSAAGAGVPGHFHFHLVPRWRGDSNFMGAVGGVRLVPEDPLEARARLGKLFAMLAGG
jgi:ATP adenylyltransferase